MIEEKRQNRALNFIVGLIVIALVITGIVSIIIFSAGKIKGQKRITDKARFEQYRQLIEPVIMNDPDTFDDVSTANQSQLTSISIWSILKDNNDPDKYEYTGDGMLVPAKEVEEKFKKLFGPDIKINHESVDGGGIEFKYSEKKDCYIIPITGITPIYTPKIISADEKGNSVILSVGYLASTDWAQDSEGNMVEPEPAKYMKVTLRKSSSGEYYVASVQNTQ